MPLLSVKWVDSCDMMVVCLYGVYRGGLQPGNYLYIARTRGPS